MAVLGSDNGRGLPVGLRASGKPTIEMVYCRLMPVVNLAKVVYKSAGGLHR